MPHPAPSTAPFTPSTFHTQHLPQHLPHPAPSSPSTFHTQPNVSRASPHQSDPPPPRRATSSTASTSSAAARPSPNCAASVSSSGACASPTPRSHSSSDGSSCCAARASSAPSSSRCLLAGSSAPSHAGRAAARGSPHAGARAPGPVIHCVFSSLHIALSASASPRTGTFDATMVYLLPHYHHTLMPMY